jgi:hypothetical protein
MALLTLQQAELTAGDAAANDDLGASVTISGDTALVGAPGKTVGAVQGAGAAYVFVRTGTTWSQEAELTSPDPLPTANFGVCVALAGDTAIVGAPCSWGTGAAYVFTGSGASWSQQAALMATGGASGDVFGSSVALSSDGTTVLVGAPLEPGNGLTGANAPGAVYAFSDSGASWTQAELTASTPVANGAFGQAVAIDGTTALIGAPSENFSTGAAYVFTESGSAWAQAAKLTASDAAQQDSFGSAVALQGTTALIGAPLKTVNGKTHAGAAYVFTSAGANWTQRADLRATIPAVDDDFGMSTVLSGSTALIAAPYRAVGGQSSAGAVDVFSGSGATWSRKSELTAAHPSSYAVFGVCAALSGSTALIGASDLAINGQQMAGAAFVDSITTAPTVGLKASIRTAKVGRAVVLTGVVSHASSTARSVAIERRVGSKLVRLKTAGCSASGTFRWRWKPSRVGKWTLVAVYRVAGHSFTSKAITVTVLR